jgi:DNA end-binding protein Ku
MSLRSSWKGFLNLSLVSVPVKAYTLTSSDGHIRLNQMHSVCNSRIRQKMKCPLCSDVPRDEIVVGYEYANDQYVVIDTDELENLRAVDESRVIRIDGFFAPDTLDPIHHSDTSYYLLPDGVAGEKPYALLYNIMVDEGLVCMARVVLHNKEQLVLVRPIETLLCMTVLRLTTDAKRRSDFDDESTQTTVSGPS